MPDDGAVACGRQDGGVHGPCGEPPHPTIAFKAVIAYHAVSVRSFHGKRRFVDLDLLRRICRWRPRLREPFCWRRLLAIEVWRGRGRKWSVRGVLYSHGGLRLIWRRDHSAAKGPHCSGFSTRRLNCTRAET